MNILQGLQAAMLLGLAIVDGGFRLKCTVYQTLLIDGSGSF